MSVALSGQRLGVGEHFSGPECVQFVSFLNADLVGEVQWHFAAVRVDVGQPQLAVRDRVCADDLRGPC
jgi:hypothetical protein